MRKRFRLLKALVKVALIALALLTVPWPKTPSAAEKVIFKFDWVPYGKYIGFYAAREKGMYKKAGMDMEFQRGFGAPAGSVAAGKQDFGIDGVGSVVVARSKNLNVKLIAMWHERLMYNVLLLKSSGIRTPQDLEGKKLGVTFGDALHRNFPVFANAVGLKNWEWVGVRPAVKNASLLSKKVDAIITYATITIPARIGAKKIGEELVEFLWSDYGVRLPTDGLIATDKKIQERPDQVKGFVAASLNGNAWAIENPDEGVKIFLKYHPDQNPELTRQWWNLSSRFQVWGNLKKHGLGYMDPDIMKYTRDAIVKAYELKNPPTLEEYYTSKFLPEKLPKPKLPKM